MPILKPKGIVRSLRGLKNYLILPENNRHFRKRAEAADFFQRLLRLKCKHHAASRFHRVHFPDFLHIDKLPRHAILLILNLGQPRLPVLPRKNDILRAAFCQLPRLITDQFYFFQLGIRLKCLIHKIEDTLIYQLLRGNVASQGILLVFLRFQPEILQEILQLRLGAVEVPVEVIRYLLHPFRVGKRFPADPLQLLPAVFQQPASGGRHKVKDQSRHNAKHHRGIGPKHFQIQLFWSFLLHAPASSIRKIF